jgi:hypothetical protein
MKITTFAREGRNLKTDLRLDEMRGPSTPASFEILSNDAVVRFDCTREAISSIIILLESNERRL